MGREALLALVRYAFDDLGLSRVSAEVYANNVRSLRMLETAGFEREGNLRASVLQAAGFVDEYLYVLLAPQRLCP